MFTHCKQRDRRSDHQQSPFLVEGCSKEGEAFLAFSLTGRHSRQSENGVPPNHRKSQFAMTAWQLY